MLHHHRRFAVTVVPTTGELTEKLTEHIWTLCTCFEYQGLLLVNDSFSEDGAQEYAVYRMENCVALHDRKSRMNHRAIILTISFLIVVAIVGGVVYVEWPEAPPNTLPETPPQLRSGPSPAESAEPILGIVGTPTVRPTSLIAAKPTLVTVEIPIPDPGLIAGSVNLQRLDQTGKVVAVLGMLHDDGLNGDAVAGNKVFTIQTTLNDPTVGQLRLQVSASMRGLLRRVASNVILVEIVEARVFPEPEPGVFSDQSLGIRFQIPDGYELTGNPHPKVGESTYIRESGVIGCKIDFSTAANPDLLPLEDWTRINRPPGGGDPITIAGLQGLRRTFIDEEISGAPVLTVLLLRDHRVYDLGTHFTRCMTVLDQIVSTISLL